MPVVHGSDNAEGTAVGEARVTSQFPDEVCFRERSYAVTAVEGAGLFDPAEHGVTPGPLSTACWRGFFCRYSVRGERLVLDAVEMGRPEGEGPAAVLFGVAAGGAGARAVHRNALVYRGLAAPAGFTGRLLCGADLVRVGRLNMGFQPAWRFERVVELGFRAGQLVSAVDRSVALAEVRRRLGADGLGPAAGESTGDWVERAFSLSFDYSWPGGG